MANSKFKAAGGAAGGFILLLALIALPVMLLFGAAEFSVWALEWIPNVIGLATLACLLIVPLALIPATRGAAGRLFGAASIAFLACLWLYALAFTYLEWGLFGVIIGVMMFGAGVVLTGVVAALFTGTWMVLANIAILFAAFVITRMMSGWMSHLADQRRLERQLRVTPGSAVIDQ